MGVCLPIVCADKSVLGLYLDELNFIILNIYKKNLLKLNICGVITQIRTDIYIYIIYIVFIPTRMYLCIQLKDGLYI